MLTFHKLLIYSAARVASGGDANALPGRPVAARPAALRLARRHRRDALASSAGLPLALCEDVEAIDSEVELTVAKQRVSSMMDQFFDLSGDDTLVAAWYADWPRGRVRINIRCLGHPTVEEISAMADALDDEFHGMVCVEGPLWDGTIRMPTVNDRFAPMADAGADPPALPKFIGPVDMEFDRRNPPDSDSTTLHLLVTQSACASGRSGVERMLKPEVIESATEIRVAMGVIEGCGGRCPGNPYVPITIKLAAPIGRRMIVDGLSRPPRPLLPKRLRLPRRYRRDALVSALAALGGCAGVLWVVSRATRRWRRALDHTS